MGQVTAKRIHPALQEVDPRAEASRRGRNTLWLSAGYGVQALGQVTAKRIHPALQEVEVKTKVGWLPFSLVIRRIWSTSSGTGNSKENPPSLTGGGGQDEGWLAAFLFGYPSDMEYKLWDR